jgi:hypothetical protein
LRLISFSLFAASP